ncbi:hypothetical protein CEXT_812291 [Caerostris extrusa]|uniref:Uncharacterized protein n=1 Tax=Caerostris extrusa TaxID=172846 RepID=A0AAV4UT47_CAEEX|nr:hypothetical protein CEXT_812291 [Caerostris extrusa]
MRSELRSRFRKEYFKSRGHCSHRTNLMQKAKATCPRRFAVVRWFHVDYGSYSGKLPRSDLNNQYRDGHGWRNNVGYLFLGNVHHYS